jgi:hypothetical protein
MSPTLQHTERTRCWVSLSGRRSTSRRTEMTPTCTERERGGRVALMTTARSSGCRARWACSKASSCLGLKTPLQTQKQCLRLRSSWHKVLQRFQKLHKRLAKCGVRVHLQHSVAHARLLQCCYCCQNAACVRSTLLLSSALTPPLQLLRPSLCLSRCAHCSSSSSRGGAQLR